MMGVSRCASDIAAFAITLLLRFNSFNSIEPNSVGHPRFNSAAMPRRNHAPELEIEMKNTFLLLLLLICSCVEGYDPVDLPASVTTQHVTASEPPPTNDILGAWCPGPDDTDIPCPQNGDGGGGGGTGGGGSSDNGGGGTSQCFPIQPFISSHLCTGPVYVEGRWVEVWMEAICYNDSLFWFTWYVDTGHSCPGGPLPPPPPV